MRFEALVAAALLASQPAHSATEAGHEAVEGSGISFIHGEKRPAGSLLNVSLGLAETVSPEALIQIGNDVYLDADGDGNPELIVAHAHHDGAGRMIAGLAPGAPDADESISRAEQRRLITAGLKGLAGQNDAGRLSEADYRLAQARWLVGLQAGTFGIAEGLAYLLELWEDGLISPLCYGIKRHELLDAL